MDTQNNSEQSSQTPLESTPVMTVHSGGDKTLMGILSYLGPLVIISYLVKKDDPFVKFHIKQGLVLLALEVILWVLGSMIFLWTFWSLYRIIHLALVILSIIGIINVVQGKEKPLPVVGSLSSYFPI